MKPRMKKDEIKTLFNRLAGDERYLKGRANYYNRELKRFYKFMIPDGGKVLELGCGGGDLLGSLMPREGVGIDISEEMVNRARKQNPGLEFIKGDVERPYGLNGVFDYIIGSDLVGYLDNIYKLLQNIKGLCGDDTRFVFSFYNRSWEPLVKLAELLRLKTAVKIQNWVSLNDMENLLEICGYKTITKGKFILLPVYIPIVSSLFNRILAKLPLIRNICLVQYIIARKPMPQAKEEYSCSVIVPCLNEKGNIDELVAGIPELGKRTEIIFIDGNSTDGTIEKIEEAMDKYPDKNISLIDQGGPFGKNDAVRKGFGKASGDILLILDSDNSVDPESLLEFYEVISSGRGEFINGSRLVYALDAKSMRFLNILANMFFSSAFTYLLNQKIKDTLCGTKVIFKKHWERINADRGYFGEFDPFGDFELLFGASKMNLDIVELPVKYRERKYGDVKIRRFRHGFLLLKMTLIGLWKLKIKGPC